MSIQVTVAAHAPRSGLITRLLRRLSVALALRQHRRALLKLEPRLLRDIGLTETDAQREADRSFWDVPAHWRG